MLVRTVLYSYEQLSFPQYIEDLELIKKPVLSSQLAAVPCSPPGARVTFEVLPSECWFCRGLGKPRSTCRCCRCRWLDDLGAPKGGQTQLCVVCCRYKWMWNTLWPMVYHYITVISHKYCMRWLIIYSHPIYHLWSRKKEQSLQ